MEKGQGKRTDTLQTDNVFTHKECIEREVALESLCIGCEYVPIDEKEVCPYRFTGCQEYANIFAIPAADVVPARHGRWMDKIDPWDRQHIGKCSECGQESCDFMYFHFCPNCGARMDGDGDV